MEKSIQAIQKKADQIYNKFKSYFAYQVSDVDFFYNEVFFLHICVFD